MRTVLWDMDGTIADSEETHYQAWQISLAKYGVSYSYEHFISDFGRSNNELIPDLLDMDPRAGLVQQISSEKEATFRQLARNNGLLSLPGVVEWLGHFKEAGVQQVVSSSGPMANIVASVDILDIGNHFLALMSGATLPRSKPDPTIFLNSAAAVCAAPHECFVVEDSMHGVEGAQRGGMGCIAVGNVAGSSELAQLVETSSEFACLPVSAMTDVTWEGCEDLWRKAANR